MKQKLINLIFLTLIFFCLIFNSSVSGFSIGEIKQDINNLNISNSKIKTPLFRNLNILNLIHKELEKNNIFNKFVFNPEDIKLEDDAFHGSEAIHSLEWWYFDADLNNGYKIQTHIMIVKMFTLPFLLTRINIYRETELILKRENIYSIDNVVLSHISPEIMVNDNKILEGKIDHITGKLIYTLNLEINDLSINLQFLETAKGWKGTTPFGNWAVILPKADVNGFIFFNQEKIDVHGIGYHDHNWDITPSKALNYGWLWGKINLDNYSIVWSSITRTRITNEPLMVIANGDEYINIHPDDIQFFVNNYDLNNWALIPNIITIKVKTERVNLEVLMQVIDTHYTRKGILQYWRFHIKCIGFIKIDSETEEFNTIQIAEILRTRY